MHNGQGSAQFEPDETDNTYGAIGFDCIIIPGAFVPAADDIEFGDVIDEAADYGAPVTTQTPATVLTVYSTEDNYMTPSPPQICGNGAGIGIGAPSLGQAASGRNAGIGKGVLATLAVANAVALTICTRSEPFMLEFISDDIDGVGGDLTLEFNTEIGNDGQKANLGFTISHTQLECT
jgi:hypothetical protein